MRTRTVLCSLMSLTLTLSTTIYAEDKGKKTEQTWCDLFSPDRADLANIGKNSYFILLPTYRLHFERGKDTRVTKVLNQTELVAGVETRVLEERETKHGELVKVSRIFLAISRTTGDVYCFGKDVDICKNDKVTGHDGTWRAGIDGAKCSLWIPGKPTVGDRYYRAIAPGIAMDRSEIISRSETVKTPVGTYEKCLHTRETSDLKSGSVDKLYAMDVGLIKDGDLVLVNVFCPPKGTIVP